MVRNNDVKSWMKHRIPKKEAFIQEGYETLNVWECTNCEETLDDIVVSPASRITKCPNCGGQEWKIILISRPVRRIIWR